MHLLKNSVALISSILIFSVFLRSAYGQIAPPPNYDQKLKDVIVDATRSGTPLDEIPLNTTILTKEALEIAPDQTIDQVLKNVPGVILNDQPYYQKDPTGQSINTRGLGNARTLVLIDGAPANDAFYGTVQWNLVPLSAVDSVEYIRGGVSSLWGNFGMGGVINIKTKNPKNSQQDVSASYGSYGTGNIAASKDIIASDSMQLRFSADYFSTAGYQNVATISPGSPSNIYNGQGPASSDNSNFRLQGYFKPTTSTNGFFRMGYHTMADLSSGYSFATNLKQDTDIAAGTRTQIDGSSNVQVNFFYQNTIFNKQNGSTASPTATGLPYISATYQNPYSTIGGGAQYTKNLTSLIDQVVVGFDGRNISGSNLANNFNANGSNAMINYAKGQQNFYGALAQIKSKSSLIPLEATLSARLDYWNSQTSDYYNQTSTGTANQAVPNQSKTMLNPTLGLLYQASKNWDLRSAAYRAFHAPGMNNTLRTYGSSRGWTFANPNLTPETMTGYEFGTDYRWKSGFSQLTFFNNYIQNAVARYTLSPTNSTDQALAQSLCNSSATWTGTSSNYGVCNGATSLNYYTNKQNLLSQGIETQYHHDISQNWALDLNYAYTQTKLTMSATSDPANKQVGGVPRNIAGAGITYYPIPKASITTTMRYVGSSSLNTRNTLIVPSYTIFGLRANYELNRNIVMFASVVNLFNREFITFGTGSSSVDYTQGTPQSIAIGAKITF
jgi:iron complex outermembrane receptor protein